MFYGFALTGSQRLLENDFVALSAMTDRLKWAKLIFAPVSIQAKCHLRCYNPLFEFFFNSLQV